MRISLKAARVNKKLTQKDVATALNVSKKTVWAWENGKTMPNVNKIEALCSLLGRNYDEIQWNV